ncbi:recombination protein NinB [Lysobacter sp. GCM10012299]|uniref:recombination protein NinB n=1 Tax=Lysobacter sp. GCM10012299 TaxID=3317333 RepID=UPI003622C5DA
MKQVFISKRDNPARRAVVDRAIGTINALASGDDFQVTISDVARTLDQNAAMWASLHDFASQIDYPVINPDGSRGRAGEDDLKAILTAAFEQETRMAPGLHGGTVFLGARTSKYGKKRMGQFLSFVHAEGAQRGVVWSEKAKDDLAFYTRGAK